jgi:hypothetical protein
MLLSPPKFWKQEPEPEPEQEQEQEHEEAIEPVPLTVTAESSKVESSKVRQGS